MGVGSSDILSAIRYMVAPIQRRVRGMIARAVVQLVDDSLQCQGLQLTLLADEVVDDVEHFQEYGFTSRPFAGAEALHLAVGGDRGHGIAIAVTDRRYRPTDLEEGEVCLFTDEGKQFHAKRNGEVIVGENATELAALASKCDERFQAIFDAMAGAAVLAQDGGSTLKTNFCTALNENGWPGTPTVAIVDSVAATKVKVL